VTIDPEATSKARPEAIESGTAASTGDRPPPEAPRKTGDLKPRPKTVLELVEYAYDAAGKKLALVRRDLRQLVVDPQSADGEMHALRRLAAADPFLAVPPSMLSALAELGAELPVRRRILQLVLAALASHPVFGAQLERLADPAVAPELSAREVSDAARRMTFDILGLQDSAAFKAPARERLRVNAVTAFLLFRVLRDGWTLDRFVADMTAVVWTTPSLPRQAGAAALLATSRSPEAMSQLSRHFERLLADSGQQAAEARASAVRESRRADMVEAEYRHVAKEVESEKLRARNLLDQIADLTHRLEAEQSSHVVDTSHHAYDYEALRTQVIRRLSAQADLLNDGLHALRNGRTDIADEFLDRSLTAIEGEVARLKDLDGSRQ
jgi:hypothetical protein